MLTIASAALQYMVGQADSLEQEADILNQSRPYGLYGDEALRCWGPEPSFVPASAWAWDEESFLHWSPILGWYLVPR